jgi:hypothetical protein
MSSCIWATVDINALSNQMRETTDRWRTPLFWIRAAVEKDFQNVEFAQNISVGMARVVRLLMTFYSDAPTSL